MGLISRVSSRTYRLVVKILPFRQSIRALSMAKAGGREYTVHYTREQQKKWQLKEPKDQRYTAKKPYVKALIVSEIGKQDMAMEALTGVPDELLADRRVRIYKPSRNPMQSGVQNIKNWRIEFNVKERWETPAMGWGSTADPLSNVAGWLKFKTKEDAIAFCHRSGWNITEINEPNVAKPISRTYGDNFSWDKRTRVGNK